MCWGKITVKVETNVQQNFLEREHTKTISDQQKLRVFFNQQKYAYFRQKEELKSRRNDSKYIGKIK